MNVLKKAFALLLILTMFLPCLPVIAAAEEDGEETVTYAKRKENVTVDAAYAWLEANCMEVVSNVRTFTLDSTEDLAYFMACGRTNPPKNFAGEVVKLGDNITWNEGTATKDGFVPADSAKPVYCWEPYHTDVDIYTASSNQANMYHSFAGTFDGCGYTISGLFVKESSASRNVGFFAGLKGATVKNVRFANSYMEGVSNEDKRGVGMVAGAFYNACTFENIFVSNCHVVGVKHVGGVIGASLANWNATTLTLIGCVVDEKSTVTGTSGVGGVLGVSRNNGALKDCVSYAVVSGIGDGVENIGGFAGSFSKTPTISGLVVLSSIKMGDSVAPASLFYKDSSTPQSFNFADADNNVMTIEGTQVKPKYTGENSENVFDARIVASIDFDNVVAKSDVKELGIQVAKLGEYAANGEGALKTQTCATAYTSICSTNFGNISVGTGEGKIDADYLTTLVLTEIPAEGNFTILTRAYYKTESATVHGNFAAVTFVNGKVMASTHISNILEKNEIALACSLDTTTYNVASLFPEATSVTVKKAGQSVADATQATLDKGINKFEVSFVQNSLEFSSNVSIARREGHLVVFNANGGKNGCSITVADGEKVTPPVPSRANHTFAGWTTDGSTAADFTAAITSDMTFIAKWTKNSTTTYTSQTLGKAAALAANEFESINAGLHVVWKDYADAFGYRPASVTCVLTQTYGSTTNQYYITLQKDSVAWTDTALSGATLAQGEGGAWTLSLKNLPKKVGTASCTYSLAQKPLDGNYTSIQSGSAAINTVKGYVPAKDDTAKLITQNGRFYDVAGNMIVFTGVVSANLNWTANLNNTTSPKALAQFAEKGGNVLRVSIPIVASGDMYYVYQAVDANFRTGDYNDSNAVQASDTQKQAVIDATCAVIDRATEAGIYIIIDWTILTSNPNDYLSYAKDFFGRLSTLYPNNPYVIYELCNEPAGCSWSGENGIKEYAEALIPEIRKNAPDAVCIVAPRGASNYISMSDAIYSFNSDKKENGGNAFDDPITDPVRMHNVAYTQHPYAFENVFSDSNGRNSFGWRIRDAYDAGLTMICTEMSPMASKLEESDPLGYDFNQMNKYMRMLQEYDISYCYFKYHTTKSYTEWCMLLPGVNPSTKTWTRDDLTECGKWYYDLITGDGVFITDIDYEADTVKSVRDTYATTFSDYGLEAVSGFGFFTPFPTFAVSGTGTGSQYYFKVSDSDTLNDIQYQTYCQSLLTQIQKSDTAAPTSTDDEMQVTYSYGARSCTLNVSYGQHTDGTWGIFFKVQ